MKNTLQKYYFYLELQMFLSRKRNYLTFLKYFTIPIKLPLHFYGIY